jgi:ABC-type Fe3+/spermidine/putrescine transport system ATPase subunit
MIRIDGLNYSVGAFALQDISLEVNRGEYFVLLGPSGSGKTLLLECLCGLNRIDAGTIELAGSRVEQWEPRHRGLGYLPQDYALFPHRTVRQNIAFGPRALGWSRAQTADRVDELLERFDLAPLADRLPARLSGGEKQRVALARAMAVRPQVLLLDEPVSALDESTRDTLCRELKQTQVASGMTTVHVCHNFVEMLAVADRVGILHRGRVVQTGLPGDVLEKPANLEMARFVQSGNLLPVRAEEAAAGHRLVGSGAIEFCIEGPLPPGSAERMVAVVRPERVELFRQAPRTAGDDRTLIKGSVSHVADLGGMVRVGILAEADPGCELVATMSKREYNAMLLRRGDAVVAAIRAEDLHLIGGETP